MKPCLLFRASLAEESELAAAEQHFTVWRSRSRVPSDALVVARYCALPFYQELEADLAVNGSELINTYREHRYVADMRNWYDDFLELTPETWFRLEDVPRGAVGDALAPFVLKGATNSRKGLWRTHMFAPTRADVMTVAARLMDDTLIGNQGLYVRRFERFVSFGEGLNGIPITNEWRCFFLDGELLVHGFYWSEHVDEILASGRLGWNPPTAPPPEFLVEIGRRLALRIRFAVADVALHEDGRWRLVELNDGQQAGLSTVEPDRLYAALRAALASLASGG